MKENWHSRHIYQNELDKTCLKHDMAYEDYRDLPRTTSDKVLHVKAFDIGKNPKEVLLQWIIHILIKHLLIWGGDLEDLQLKSKCNIEFRFYYLLLVFMVNMPGFSFKGYKKY